MGVHQESGQEKRPRLGSVVLHAAMKRTGGVYWWSRAWLFPVRKFIIRLDSDKGKSNV
jgi:hypothetical protein